MFWFPRKERSDLSIGFANDRKRVYLRSLNGIIPSFSVMYSNPFSTGCKASLRSLAVLHA